MLGNAPLDGVQALGGFLRRKRDNFRRQVFGHLALIPLAWRNAAQFSRNDARHATYQDLDAERVRIIDPDLVCVPVILLDDGHEAKHNL
jgi:hypothetical protein